MKFLHKFIDTCILVSVSTVCIHLVQDLTVLKKMQLLSSESSMRSISRACLVIDIICSREKASFICKSLWWLKFWTSCRWNPSMQSLVTAETKVKQVPNVSFRGRTLSSSLETSAFNLSEDLQVATAERMKLIISF